MSSNLNPPYCNHHPLPSLFSSDQALFTSFLQDQAAPTSHPVLSALAWPGHCIKPEKKDTAHPSLLLAATAALPISSGTSLACCQVPALPRETCFRGTSKPGSCLLQV